MSQHERRALNRGQARHRLADASLDFSGQHEPFGARLRDVGRGLRGMLLEIGGVEGRLAPLREMLCVR